ncbi:Thioredoxin domain-containing protein 17 [Paragonimus heterotremus]|uniref:Thioredoxin domain-containing protein 17 n=1 Tax=Paragonimus heterotremus TaxID=100268 RepID=A0A8J4TD15_9TREM|nr:Thioredoxin domain-containing protein 17 [Paragonimus heterotremus]
MPAEQKYVESIAELESTAKTALAAGRRVSVFMIGSTDPQTGESWCPDCREAEPVVEACLKKTADNDLFLMIEVGLRDAWKNPDNAFRKHPVYKLTVIPTMFLFCLDSGEIAVKCRLENDECKSAASVDKLLAGEC